MLKFIAFVVCINIHLLAQTPFKKHLEQGMPGDSSIEGNNPSRTKNCNTGDPKRYDGNTAVSFWGDSRIDYVSDPFYGNSSLDV